MSHSPAENPIDSLPLYRSASVPAELAKCDSPAATLGATLPPLTTMLGYATGVAASLRERHAEMRLASEGPGTEQTSDIAAFGSMLYDLMAGSRPPHDLSQVKLPRGPRSGLDGVRLAATRLALRCLGAVGSSPEDMQQVLTELRLYTLIARQYGCQPEMAMELAPLPAVPELAGVVPAKASPQHPGVYQYRKTEHSPGSAGFAAPLDAPESTSLPGVECPVCCSRLVHRSRPRTRFEHLLTSIGIHINRCHRCLYRYVAVMGVEFTKRAFYRAW